MILIDSVFIHTGGGLTILKYLIERLENHKNNIFYLFDSRFKIPDSLAGKIINCSFANGFMERYKFYNQKNEFETIFCLGNLAPPLKQNVKTITYLHSDWYVAKPIVKKLKEKITPLIKRLIFQHYVPCSDIYIVQTQSMKKKFLSYNKFDEKKVYIYPVFETLTINNSIEKDSNSYIYVSEGYFHKNHCSLIDAFNKYTKINPDAKLYLTVKESVFPEIKEKLKEINNPNIINLGFIEKNQLEIYYLKSKYLIYPSKQESFGLGIVEAIQYNCHIIASDLDYVYDICQPSLTFNPYNTQSIYQALVNSMSDKNIKPSYIKTSSKIDELINIILN